MTEETWKQGKAMRKLSAVLIPGVFVHGRNENVFYIMYNVHDGINKVPKDVNMDSLHLGHL